ncbi:TolB family protein [Armatimonas sp.]|uniref:TolB family protein n=1 Tax=Armatimonas sp. TaxID=1872638 RepID=UPI0037524593
MNFFLPLCFVVAITVSPFPLTAPAERKGVEEIGKLLQKKPTIIIGNVRNFGRIKSLITEMKLKDGFSELDFDSPINSKQIEKASLLILVDREQGDISAELEYLIPASVKAGSSSSSKSSSNASSGRLDKGDITVFATEERKDGYRVVYISAPNRDALISFIDIDLRSDDTNLKDYDRKLGPKSLRKVKRPSAPEILFPTGILKTTRPPIFFLASRETEKQVFDIQFTPSAGSKDRRREEFGREGSIFQTSDGGWVAFDQAIRPADEYELNIWGVKLPQGLERTNRAIYVYEPNFDVQAGRPYSVRVRSRYLDARDSKPGMWSSEEEDLTVNVPQQPTDLGPAESLTRNDETTEFLDPVFSIDGKLMLYRTNRSSKSNDVNNIWEIFADNPITPGTGSNKITGSNRGSSDLKPSWGPVLGDNVGYVTFSRQESATRGGKMAQNLWYVAVPTAEKPDVPFGMTQLTNFDQRCFDPAWSSDGKRCAFSKENGRGEIEIWLVEPGKNPRVLVNGITPAWGIDNRTLYYSSKEGGSFDIWTIDTLSGAKKSITSEAGDEFSPAINPTGNGDIAYVSTASGNYDIWVLRGRNSVQLTQWLGNDISPTWTPDGKKLVFATTRFSTKQRYGLASIDPYGIK